MTITTERIIERRYGLHQAPIPWCHGQPMGRTNDRKYSCRQSGCAAHASLDSFGRSVFVRYPPEAAAGWTCWETRTGRTHPEHSRREDRHGDADCARCGQMMEQGEEK